VCVCVSVTALASDKNALKAKVRYQQKVLDAGNTHMGRGAAAPDGPHPSRLVTP